jgi:hypothetical protein
MKLLFQNFTPHTAYIAIIDYDGETKYIGDPIILEVDASDECLYESSPNYFYGARISGRGSFCRSFNHYNVIEFYSNERYYWSTYPYNNYTIDNLGYQYVHSKL